MELPGPGGQVQGEQSSPLGAALFVLPSVGFLAQAVYAVSLYQSPGCAKVEDCPRGLKFFGAARVDLLAAAVLLAGVVVLILVGVGRRIRAWLSQLQRLCRAVVLHCGTGCCSSLWRWVRQQPLEEDPDARRVRREFQKQRLHFAGTALARMALPLLCCLVSIMLRDGFDGRGGLRVAAWKLLYNGVVIPFCILAAIATAADVKPSIVTPRFLHHCDVLLTAMWIWKGAVQAPHAWQSAYILTCGGLRIFFGMVVGNPRQTALTNLLVFAANVFNLVNRKGMRRGLLSFELCVTIAVYGAMWLWHEYQLGQARGAVRALKLNHGAVLVEGMLGVICDAVPRLDADLHLLEPCQRLSSLLLRDGNTLHGKSFADLVVQEDLDRMLTCLKGPLQHRADASTSFAGLCRVRLRTANSLQLPVLIYYSCVPNLDGQPEFLLGVCEDSQEELPEPSFAAKPGSASKLRGGLAALPEVHRAPEDEVRSCGGWSAASSDCEEGGPEQHSIMVDLGSGNLRVLRACASFELLGGTRGVCKGLLDWMSSSDVKRIQEHCAHAGVGEVTVRLKPRAGGGKYKCVVARALDGSGGAEPEIAAAASDPVCLTLRTTEFCPSKKKKSPKDMMQGLRENLYTNDGPLTSSMAQSAEGEALQRSGDAETDAQEVVVTVKFEKDNRLMITDISEGCQHMKELFTAVPELHKWLEDPSDFIRSMGGALARLAHAEARRGRVRVGPFACKQKRSSNGSGPQMRPGVDVMLLGVSWSVSWRSELEARLSLTALELPPPDLATRNEHAEPGCATLGRSLGTHIESSCNMSL